MHGGFHRTSIGFGFLALMSLPFAIHPHEGEATRRELAHAVRDRKGARHPSRLLLTHLGHSRSIPLVQEETEEHRVPSMERPGSVVFFRQNQERMLREHARSLFSAALQNPGFRAKPQELCGTYALSEDADGFVVKDWNDRCTSARAVSHFAELALSRGVRGARRAARLSSLLATGSHSPAETNVYLLLCLPKRHGGYGLTKPLMNPALKLSSNGFRLLSTEKNRDASPFDPVRRPDLFWSKSRIALEYESDMAHSGKEKLVGDSKRRCDLEKAGIHVLTLTSRQLYNERVFDKMARTLIRLTGGRQRGEDLGERFKRLELREKVLFDGKQDHARQRDGSFASNAIFDDALQ